MSLFFMPIQNLFAGMKPVEPFIAWTPSHDAEVRKQYLAEFTFRLQGLENLPSIPYHPNSHFNEEHRLKEEYK